jgi:hypothetical protein
MRGEKIEEEECEGRRDKRNKEKRREKGYSFPCIRRGRGVSCKSLSRPVLPACQPAHMSIHASNKPLLTAYNPFAFPNRLERDPHCITTQNNRPRYGTPNLLCQSRNSNAIQCTRQADKLAPGS